MGDVQHSLHIGMGPKASGLHLNIYDTYAHALAHAATGLSTIYAVSKLDGTKGDAISQVAKSTGVPVDENGWAHFFIASGSTYFAKVSGSHIPIRFTPDA